MSDATRPGGAITAREQARQAACRRLREAAEFAELHATARPLLERRKGKGRQAVIVRLVWPGVLLVADPETGRVLARSEPGWAKPGRGEAENSAGILRFCTGRGESSRYLNQPGAHSMQAPANAPTRKPEKLLRLPEVESLSGLRKSSIYAGMKARTFPHCVRLSARAVGWRFSEIATWQAQRLQGVRHDG